jgi:predicted amidophosphoribosyltransferase
MLADAIEDLDRDFPHASVAVASLPRDRAKRGPRGFNQAELITRAGLKLQPSPVGLRLLEGVLQGKRDASPQTGLTSHHRRENVRGCRKLSSDAVRRADA